MKSKVKQKKEHRVDAKALSADERRGKLRKAAGGANNPLIRRCLNGETRYEELSIIHTPIHNVWKGTAGTETSKYGEEEKETSIS